MQTFCGGSMLRYVCQKLTGKSAFHVHQPVLCRPKDEVHQLTAQHCVLTGGQRMIEIGGHRLRSRGAFRCT